MPVPNNFSTLSAVSSSNPPTGGEGPSEGDDHIRQIYAFLASISSNTGNGWNPPYLPKAGGTLTGPVTFNAVSNFAASPAGSVVGSFYTPTITNVDGLSAGGSADTHFYVRIGEACVVFGSATKTPNNNSSATFSISLPITPPSGYCVAVGGGSAQIGSNINASVVINSNLSSPVAMLVVYAPAIETLTFRYWFAYRVT